MIEWITDNKEWLFSGIGVALLSALVGWLLRRHSRQSPRSLPQDAPQTSVSPRVTASSSGDSSPAIAIGGDVKDSKIVVNAGERQRVDFTGQTKTVVDEILQLMESVQPSFPDLARDNPIITDTSSTLRRDPYNIPALLVRGQAYYTSAMAFGGKGLREALADFEQAAKADMKLADPYFGIGTVLYQLALFDLAKRGRYRIHKRGGLRINKDTGLLEMLHPQFELLLDNRNRTVLQAALHEFQEGQKLQQLYDRTQGATTVIFAPQDVQNRIRSLRGLLGYEPAIGPDDELVKTFSMVLSKIEPKAFEQLFQIQKD
jgi:hypothetical protein